MRRQGKHAGRRRLPQSALARATEVTVDTTQSGPLVLWHWVVKGTHRSHLVISGPHGASIHPAALRPRQRAPQEEGHRLGCRLDFGDVWSARPGRMIQGRSPPATLHRKKFSQEVFCWWLEAQSPEAPPLSTLRASRKKAAESARAGVDAASLPADTDGGAAGHCPPPLA